MTDYDGDFTAGAAGLADAPNAIVLAGDLTATSQRAYSMRGKTIAGGNWISWTSYAAPDAAGDLAGAAVDTETIYVQR